MKIDRALVGIIAIVAIVIIMIIGAICDTFNKSNKLITTNKELVYKVDSLQHKCDSLDNVIDDIIDDLQTSQNECNYMVDSLTEELDVAKIKLDRIKEYNRIAGQGNNITFLRGWINRVLND